MLCSLDVNGLVPLLGRFDSDFCASGATAVSGRGISRTLKLEDDAIELWATELSESDGCCKSGRECRDEGKLALLYVRGSVCTGTCGISSMFSMARKALGTTVELKTPGYSDQLGAREQKRCLFLEFT